MCDYLEKKKRFLELMSQYAQEDVMIAFSGGVDSCLLLKAACESAKATGKKVYGITMATRMHPVREIQEAKRLCEKTGSEHIVITVDELREAGIENNPVERCYLCKRHLFARIKEKAAELSAGAVLEGTNEDDLHVYRPGIRALQELEIISPLAQAGLTKAQVRRMAQEYGLETASKPSSPCLATRFPYGAELTYEKMEQVERGENYLKTFGLHNIRIRVYERLVRIEVDEKDFPCLLGHKEEITTYLKGLGYIYITLDLEGFRSGSMDVEVVKDCGKLSFEELKGLC